METVTRFILQQRALVLIVTLVLVVAAVLGIRRLEFTSDYRVFFSEQNPQLQAFERLQNTYTKNDNVLIALAPKDGQVFTRATLATIETITTAGWQVPYSLRVDSITNFQYTEGRGDDLIVRPLVKNVAQLSESDIARVRDITLAEPLLVNRLVSNSGHVTGVNITINLPGKNPRQEVPEVVNHVRQLADRIRAEHPNLDVHLTGVVMMNHAFFEASKNDMRTLVPIMFLVVILALWFLLRQFSAVVATVSVIVLSIVSTVGILGWLGLKFTPPSSAAPTIILTLAVADSVHLLESFFFHLRQGMDRRAAMAEAWRVNIGPVFITSITTAVGLLALNFSESPPLRDLGNFVALGVTLAWLFSFTWLPALMMVLPIKVRQEKSREHLAMERLANLVIRRQRLMFWGSVVLIVGLAAAITRNELNDAFVEYFDPSLEFRSATDFVTDNLTGIYNIDYSLSAGESQGISDPAYLAKVEEFAQWLRAQPEVVHVNSLTDVAKRLNKNLHGDDPKYYRIPEARDLAAQYLLLYEMSLPFGLDLNNQINVDKSAPRLSVTLRNVRTNEFLGLEKRGQEWLKANAPASMQGEGSSPGVMFSHIGKRNLDSMVPGNILSLLFVSLTLIVGFRSFKFGVVSIIPNAVPIVMGFGIWGLLVGEVGMSLAVVGSMTLGIVVDDTIHFVSKYLRARREQGLSPEDAVRYAFASVGTAMVVLSLVLIAGFAVLAFSDFKMNSGMGLLTAITFGIAIVADFLFLPTLLLKIDRNTQVVAQRRTGYGHSVPSPSGRRLG